MKKVDEKYFVETANDNANNIEDVLAQDEKILWRAKPKKKAYVWSNVLQMMPFALIWLLFDSAFIVVFATMGDVPAFAWAIFIPFMLVHLTPVWIWIANIIKASVGHKNVEYVFTDKRIIIKSGVIGIDFKNVYYTDINSVNVKVGIIDKILKVGDIYIKSNNEAVVLFDLEKPYVALHGLQKIALDIKSDILFPNELRPKTNTGYNTAYTAPDKYLENLVGEPDKEAENNTTNKD